MRAEISEEFRTAHALLLTDSVAMTGRTAGMELLELVSLRPRVTETLPAAAASAFAAEEEPGSLAERRLRAERLCGSSSSVVVSPAGLKRRDVLGFAVW